MMLFAKALPLFRQAIHEPEIIASDGLTKRSGAGWLLFSLCCDMTFKRKFHLIHIIKSKDDIAKVRAVKFIQPAIFCPGVTKMTNTVFPFCANCTSLQMVNYENMNIYVRRIERALRSV